MGWSFGCFGGGCGWARVVTGVSRFGVRVRDDEVKDVKKRRAYEASEEEEEGLFSTGVKGIFDCE